MIITSPQVKTWLAHRAGIEHATELIANYKTRAFELNQQGPQLIETFAKKQIKSFVGFVDLAGFTSLVHDKAPEDIVIFLNPFLKGAIDIITACNGAVDKTIGDEIMFILPDPEEVGMVPAILRMGQLLGGLRDLASDLGKDYKYRISLSYGDVIIDLLKSDNYSEWTLFGETIHVAKRLADLPCIENPNPVAGVFGIKANIDLEQTTQAVTEKLGLIAGFASKWIYHIPDKVVNLKGVGDVVYGHFQPRNE